MRRKTGGISRTPTGWKVRGTNLDGSKISKTFAAEEDAKIYLKLLVDAIREEESLPSNAPTVGEWIDKWLAKREADGRIRDTRSDRNRFENHILNHAIADRPLRTLSRRDVLDWLDGVRENVATQTARNILTVLRGAVGDALDLGYCRSNPAAGIRLKNPPRTKDAWTTLSLEEVSTLIAAIPSPARHVVEFAIGSGLRAGELCALRREDVGSRIVVRYGKPPDLPTKSGKPRIVPLFGLARDAWNAWQVETREWPNPHGLAFPRPGGGIRNHLHVVGTFEEWSRYVAAVGRHVRFHDLRHTCASLLVSGAWGRAWSLEEVKQLLGHSSISVTERYAHFAGSLLDDAAAETDAIKVSRKCPKLQNTRKRIYHGSN